LLKPKRHKILGCDIAGIVEAVGKNVSDLKPGDEVFGDLSAGGWGGFAEVVCADENALSLKPTGLTFAAAAATPQAALLALQAFQLKNEFKPGDHILINGGCGGVGTFAIQMAKRLGVEVTVVDGLGADQVVDYTKDDFTQLGQRYDFILDVRSNRSIFSYAQALNPNGVYATVGGNTSSILQLALLGPLIKKSVGKQLALVLHKPNQELNTVCELYEAGEVKPVVDRCFPLDETAEAFRYFGAGRFKGKVVVTMG